jgi:predicted nucleotidyltransferase
MKSQSSFGLSKKSYEKLNYLFLKYPQITQVLIYGSRAKGNNHEGSDIDLTLFTDDVDILHEDFDQIKFLAKILNEIDDLDLPYKVDLSFYHLLQNQNLIDEINQSAKVFFKRK